jgi:hypothetical protein
VNASGGYFGAITNGSCVDPLVFTIVDAAGKQTTASLSNKLGSGTPAGPATLVVSPPATTSAACSGKTFTLVIAGGTGSSNVSANPSGPTIAPQVVPAGGGSTNISGLVTGSGVTQITVFDSGSPKQVKTATITCS